MSETNDRPRFRAEPDYFALRGRMAPEVPTEMMAHIARVVGLTERFARHHNADLAAALRAAQGHDLLRALPKQEWLRKAEERGLAMLPMERERPVLLHGPLGALELEERFGVRDPRVLDAIRYHTTGHPDYGPEAWSMFVADKVEEKKLGAWPALQQVLDLADGSLEAAALAYLTLTEQRDHAMGRDIHPLAIETQEHLARRVSIPSVVL